MCAAPIDLIERLSLSYRGAQDYTSPCPPPVAILSMRCQSGHRSSVVHAAHFSPSSLLVITCPAPHSPPRSDVFTGAPRYFQEFSPVITSASGSGQEVSQISRVGFGHGSGSCVIVLLWEPGLAKA